MTDINKDGDQGTAEQPTSQGSNGGGGSVDAKALQSSLEALTKRLDEVDARSRSLQGDKDKGIKQTRKEVEELKRQIAEIDKLKKSGLDPDDAIEEFTFREEVRGLREQLARLNPASPQPAGTSAGGVATEAQRIAKELQLDMNDKDIADAVSKGDTVALFRVAVARQSNPPSPSDAPPPAGGFQRKPSDSELEREYIKAMQAAPRGKAGDEQRRAIKDKYIKAGVNIHDITFQ